MATPVQYPPPAAVSLLHQCLYWALEFRDQGMQDVFSQHCNTTYDHCYNTGDWQPLEEVSDSLMRMSKVYSIFQEPQE
ncbi:hypothetical protein KIPB_013654 [Kipferlia bialata]|uniref:Uncharacterized protein n=1 Tax=Kipferlia bialata TaxID=797122 RepID=A0A9K3GPP2_9EUKA|nr:hypothetical protein KIPB_013654 [Kipferlia bialata]|eukprot:g13654.t1